jgi:hypothetical protein
MRRGGMSKRGLGSEGTGSNAGSRRGSASTSNIPQTSIRNLLALQVSAKLVSPSKDETMAEGEVKRSSDGSNDSAVIAPVSEPEAAPAPFLKKNSSSTQSSRKQSVSFVSVSRPAPQVAANESAQTANTPSISESDIPDPAQSHTETQTQMESESIKLSLPKASDKIESNTTTSSLPVFRKGKSVLGPGSLLASISEHTPRPVPASGSTTATAVREILAARSSGKAATAVSKGSSPPQLVKKEQQQKKEQTVEQKSGQPKGIKSSQTGLTDGASMKITSGRALSTGSVDKPVTLPTLSPVSTTHKVSSRPRSGVLLGSDTSLQKTDADVGGTSKEESVSNEDRGGSSGSGDRERVGVAGGGGSVTSSERIIPSKSPVLSQLQLQLQQSVSLTARERDREKVSDVIRMAKSESSSPAATSPPSTETSSPEAGTTRKASLVEEIRGRSTDIDIFELAAKITG